jgi:hypothetical protein
MKPAKSEYARKDFIYRMYTKKDVSYFLERFNTKGLSKLEITAIRTLIEQLWRKTGSEWLPAHCEIVPEKTNLAKKIMQELQHNGVFEQISAKRYMHTHFFWSLELKTGKTVILDPTGVPVGADYDNVIPYFGLVNEAPGFHKKVYETMEDDDGRGVFHFCP